MKIGQWRLEGILWQLRPINRIGSDGRTLYLGGGKGATLLTEPHLTVKQEEEQSYDGVNGVEWSRVPTEVQGIMKQTSTCILEGGVVGKL